MLSVSSGWTQQTMPPISPRYEILETVSMGLSTTGFSCRASCPISSGIRATSNGSAASKIAMRSRVSLWFIEHLCWPFPTRASDSIVADEEYGSRRMTDPAIL